MWLANGLDTKQQEKGGINQDSQGSGLSNLENGIAIAEMLKMYTKSSVLVILILRFLSNTPMQMPSSQLNIWFWSSEERIELEI